MSRKPSLAVLLVTALVAASAIAPAGEKAPPAREKLVLRIYDVQEILMVVPDFPGPELDMAAAHSGALPVFQAQPPQPTADAANIVAFIMRRIHPESWGEGWGTYIAVKGGRLTVFQTPTVHRQIAALLKSIRGDGCRRLVIRGLVVAVDARTAAGIRARAFRSLDPKEVEKLVKDAGPDGLLASPQVICANGQRAHAWIGRQSAYVGSYCAAGDQATPNVSQLLVGTVFDVRPTLSFDGTSAEVVLRFTLAGDRRDRRKEFHFLRGGAPVVEAAAGEKGKKKVLKPATAPLLLKGQVTLPDVRLLRLRTSLTVPLNGYVLAGTMALPPAGERPAGGARTALVLLRVTPATKLARAGGKDEAGARMISRVYDIRELSSPTVSFPGPLVGLSIGGGGGGGAVVAAPPPVRPVMPAQALSEVIARTLEPESWGREGASISSRVGQLVVNHTPAVHARIRKLLSDIRDKCKPQVSMHALVIAVDDGTAARLRRREGNQFSSKEAEALLAGAGKDGLLAAPQLLCYNNQRVHAYSGRQVSYVSGYSSSGTINLPDISTAIHGWVFDVRPVLSPDRTAATAELRFTMTGERQEKEELAVELISRAHRAGKVANRLTAPQTEIISVRNSISMPVGKYVLAGTFRRKGKAGDKANVMVLIRTDIVGSGKK